MSDALYPIRLRWDGRKGVAKWSDGLMTLVTPPYLGFPYYEIDYAPPVCKLVRAHQWLELRDMERSEYDACAKYLERMASDAE